MRPLRSCSGKKISLPKSRRLSMRPASVTLSPTSGPGALLVPSWASTSPIGRASTPRAGKGSSPSLRSSSSLATRSGCASSVMAEEDSRAARAGTARSLLGQVDRRGEAESRLEHALAHEPAAQAAREDGRDARAAGGELDPELVPDH